MSERVVVIGLDGADWRILEPLIEAGVMPNLQRLIEGGVRGRLESSIPTHSNAAWATFMTGVNPGKHGVFSFQERSAHDPGKLVGVNSRSISHETMFHALSRQGRHVGSVNVPVTYPPFEVNGFLLSGMFVPEGAPYTHPVELAGELDAAVGGFPLNRVRWRFMAGEYDALLDEAIEVNRARTNALTYLLDNKRTDVFVQVFVNTDRIQHALMHLIDPAHPRFRMQEADRYRPKIHAFYRSLDDMLGEVSARVDHEGLTLFVISDHGFRPCYRQFIASEVLADNGLLRHDRRKRLMKSTRRYLRRVRGNKKGAPAKRSTGGLAIGRDVDWSHTRAYVTTANDQGVSVNLEGREPFGIVGNNGDYERARDAVIAALTQSVDPDTGRRLIAHVWRREDLYQGPFIDRAPDVIYSIADGLSVGNESKKNLGELKWRTGEHDQFGIIVGYGSGINPGAQFQTAHLMDLAPTILYLTGADIREDLDGRVLLEILDPDLASSRQPSYETGLNGFVPDEQVYSDEEEAEIAEQLRALGYM